MRPLRWLVVVSLLCGLTAVPARTAAQARDEEDTGFDVMRALFGAGRNLFVHGGLTTSGRLMLQGAAGGGERALKSEDGFNLGAGVGVDILPRVGIRLSYTYTTGNLAFRTDDGDGSNALDIADVGTLRSHVAAVELIRYMLSTRASITPYGSAGLVGAWWVLDDESGFVAAPTGSTQFRFGALATIGVQLRMAERVSTRFEAVSSSVRNPFTGNESFQAAGGATVDEPTRVNRTDFRLVGVYHFGRREPLRPYGGRGRRHR
jgi:outer membrane protein W